MHWVVFLLTNALLAVSASSCMRRSLSTSSHSLMAASFALNAASFAVLTRLLPIMPLGVAQASISGTVIVFANVAGVVVLNDVLERHQLVGMGVVLAGVVTMHAPPWVAHYASLSNS